MSILASAARCLRHELSKKFEKSKALIKKWADILNSAPEVNRKYLNLDLHIDEGVLHNSLEDNF